MLVIGALMVLNSVLLLFLKASNLVIPDKLSILLCKNKCGLFGSCTSVNYDCEHLRCELIFGINNTHDGKSNGVQIFKVQRKYSLRCSKGEMAVQARHGDVKCLKAPRTFYKGPKKTEKVDIKKARTPAKLEPNVYKPGVILYQEKNLAENVQKQTIFKLPFNVKPGMTIAVNGAYMKTSEYTQFSVIQDPRHPTNPFGWLHVRVIWPIKSFTFSVGVITSSNDNIQIISDPHNFTLAVVLKASSTEFYADNVMIFTTKKAIPWVEEVVICRYRKVYQLVIQKNMEDKMKDVKP